MSIGLWRNVELREQCCLQVVVAVSFLLKHGGVGLQHLSCKQQNQSACPRILWPAPPLGDALKVQQVIFNVFSIWNRGIFSSVKCIHSGHGCSDLLLASCVRGEDIFNCDTCCRWHGAGFGSSQLGLLSVSVLGLLSCLLQTMTTTMGLHAGSTCSPVCCLGGWITFLRLAIPLLTLCTTINQTTVKVWQQLYIRVLFV